tara:strand:+ start:537 stop:1940 length:1404 start_codon:yes stop_codon:yes gene_type:complete
VSDDKVSVATPSAKYEKDAVYWDLPKALRGGTLSMRQAGETYLPKFPAEKPLPYQDRLNQSVLFNAFWRTITVLGAKPFQKTVDLGDKADAEAIEWSKNIDRDGRSLTAFSRDLLLDLLAYGVCRYAVDMPVTKRDKDDDPLTLEQERAAGVRPFFAQLSPLTTIETRSSGSDSDVSFDRVRDTGTRIVPQGDWAEKEFETVRVITNDTYDVYIKMADEWPTTPQESTPNTLGKVPVVEIGFLVDGRPPLDDLAWLNARHWQSDSDQENILHVARVPFKHFAGFTADEVSVIDISRSKGVRSSSPDAHIDVVEHSGEAIAAGRIHGIDLKEAMSGFGVNMVVDRKSDATATGRRIDQTNGDSDLQMMVRRLASGLEQGFILAGEWIGRDLNVSVDIFDDYNFNPDDATHEQRLKRATLGFISTKTLIREDVRAGLWSDDLDVDDEIDNIETQGIDTDNDIGDATDDE